jgi:hypothetical protein
MSVSKIVKSRDKWKSRAQKKAKEANALRKQKHRLEISRSYWKQQYNQLCRRGSLSPATRSLANQAIKGHVYGSLVVVLCLSMKLYAQQSIRSISKSLAIWLAALELDLKAPSHTTVHCWLRKAGYYRLHEPIRASTQAQWVLFIDESMCMGKEKLLLILGADSQQVDQGHLSFSNCRCLHIGSQNSWKGEAIAQVLASFQAQLRGKIAFAVVDRGNNISKALRLSGIPYIYDLTHEIAFILRNLYKGATDFQAFSSWATLLRKQLVMGQWAHLAPSQQRAKARFHNIEPLCSWGKAIEEKLGYWKKEAQPIYEQFKKIIEFKPLLQELCAILEVIKNIKKLIGQQGIIESLLPDIYQQLASLRQGRAAAFAQRMRNYFRDALLKLERQVIPICCSDLIESAFGKYKLMMSNNHWNGITDLALAIPAFMHEPWTQTLVKQALEKVKVKDYKIWSQLNMEPSLLQKRRKELPKTGATL